MRNVNVYKYDDLQKQNTKKRKPQNLNPTSHNPQILGEAYYSIGESSNSNNIITNNNSNFSSNILNTNKQNFTDDQSSGNFKRQRRITILQECEALVPLVQMVDYPTDELIREVGTKIGWDNSRLKQYLHNNRNLRKGKQKQ